MSNHKRFSYASLAIVSFYLPLEGAILYGQFYDDIFYFKYLASLFLNEQGIVERLTFIALFFSIFILLSLYWKKKTSLFFVIAIFFWCAEEISWGQSIFNFHSSSWFLSNNIQNETNFHNLTFLDIEIGIALTMGLILFLTSRAFSESTRNFMLIEKYQAKILLIFFCLTVFTQDIISLEYILKSDMMGNPSEELFELVLACFIFDNSLSRLRREQISFNESW